ncbi:hypothetical protein [Tatumella sp. UBA2305]|uniref:hypothetical protein n=1 Tax=Tatumella sp. UBA2305 TaxID=1947647 RepID=UPI0025F8C9AD|nr:hypothetical protein [Tatumella sp. UBA2305]
MRTALLASVVLWFEDSLFNPAEYPPGTPRATAVMRTPVAVGIAVAARVPVIMRMTLVTGVLTIMGVAVAVGIPAIMRMTLVEGVLTVMGVAVVVGIPGSTVMGSMGSMRTMGVIFIN